MMTYIPPTGTIQMLAGVHLNPKQEDTLWYDTTASRDAAFDNFVYATYTEQSYSRPTRNSVKIQDTADRLYKCSYMRFKNGAAFGGQWIYCFVLAVEYVNNNTCEVFYEIDDMITWFPQCELRQCFVEREIPVTDNLFENLVPESIETGEYTHSTSNMMYELGEPRYIIMASTDIDGNWAQSMVNGVWSGLVYYHLELNQEVFNTIIQAYHEAPNNPENIVNIQIVPEFLVNGCFGEGSTIAQDEINIDRILPTKFGNYTPKNKKLYTSPFYKIQVSNNAGQITEYNYEDFYQYGQHEVKFAINGVTIGTPAVIAAPMNYKHVYKNYDYGLVLSNFPPAPWVNDTFKAYLAQNKASITTSILTSIVSSTISGASAYGGGQITNALGNAMQFQKPGSIKGQYFEMLGNKQMFDAYAGTGASLGSNIATTIAGIWDKQSMPKTVSNLTQADVLNFFLTNARFDFYVVHIKEEMCKVIDDYFSAYGYAQHKVKIPNTHSRPFWNYTKTQGCVVVGDVPSDALARISAIFDKGIRFWKRNSDIGNYSLNNSV